MMETAYKVTYIHHSSFCIEQGNKVFLFDYFLGDLPAFSKDCELFVFASHKHPDHFCLDIFKLASQYEKVTFFLGKDIRLSDAYLKRQGYDRKIKKQIFIAKPHTKISYHEVSITVLDSTDAGAAFLVESEGNVYFHAGDLNNWKWDQATGLENQRMQDKYCGEIDLLSGRQIDAAFIPVDPRLLQNYDLGICYFMQKTKTIHVFPMHFWREYDIIQKLMKSKNATFFSNKIAEIRQEGDCWDFKVTK